MVRQKLTRLREILAGRLAWKGLAATVRRMREWVLSTEHILSGEWATNGVQPDATQVAARFDPWIASLEARLQALEGQREVEQACLAELVRISRSLRPQVLHCYQVKGLPRPNNDMEGYIRGLKTRYRRVSGRKNWNSYLLRSGQSIAYFDWWQRTGLSEPEMLAQLRRVDRQRWRSTRAQFRQGQSDRLTVFRFRHNRDAFLKTLETRWDSTFSGTALLH
ncbi:MAG TPA: hypothetical protein VGF67_03185 [Ktedonobacteraceae bacterium]